MKKNGQRDSLLRYLKKKKIDARQMINPINEAVHIKKFISNRFKNAYKISKNSIHLPSGIGLERKQIKYIVSKLNGFFK